MNSIRVNSCCSTSCTRLVTLITNPVISYEWGKYRIGIPLADCSKKQNYPLYVFFNTSDDPITLAQIAEEQEASSLLSSLWRHPMSSKWRRITVTLELPVSRDDESPGWLTDLVAVSPSPYVVRKTRDPDRHWRKSQWD